MKDWSITALVALLLGALALKAWSVMILCGMFAGWLHEPDLAIGFWPAMAVAALFGVGKAIVKAFDD